MFDEIIKAFAELKITVESNGVGDAADAQLDSLNQQFTTLIEDWRALSIEEQGAQTRPFLRAQMDFHFIANQLLAQLQPVEQSPSHIESDPNSTVEANDDTGASPPNLIDQADNGASHSAAPEPLTPLHMVSYESHMAIMDPVFSLRPIACIDEEQLDQIIRCIHETMSRATELNVLMPVEVERNIIAYIHGLMDVTSQSMLSWQFTDAVPTLDGLICFLQVRMRRILPIERIPSSRREPSAASSSSSGPSAAKKQKKICTACKDNHNLIRCPRLLATPVDGRRAVVARLNLCENCLFGNHNVTTCSHGACRKCGTKHNSILPCPPDSAEGGSHN